LWRGDSQRTQVHYCPPKQIKLCLHNRYGDAQATQPQEDNMNAEQRLKQVIAKLDVIQKRDSIITETEKMEMTAELLVIAEQRFKEITRKEKQ
jgi:hypothetical protein